MLTLRPSKKLKNLGMGVLLLTFCLMCQFMVLMLGMMITSVTG